MDQRAWINLTMMVLDLRLAALGPCERVGERLNALRLLEIAGVLEQVRNNVDASEESFPSIEAKVRSPHPPRTDLA